MFSTNIDFKLVNAIEQSVDQNLNRTIVITLISTVISLYLTFSFMILRKTTAINQ